MSSVPLTAQRPTMVANAVGKRMTGACSLDVAASPGRARVKEAAWVPVAR